MKKLALLVIAAVPLVFMAVPASAQVSVGVGDVGVRIGSDHDRWDRDRWDRGRHYGWRHHDRFAECRAIKQRTVTPSGRVIIETRREC
jgi:hypothetical protein